jgi:hypothetical protein
MDGKELAKQILSRKFACAFIGIIALCWVASIEPGQLAVDESASISITPTPKLPAGELPFDWIRMAVIVAITLITCLTVWIQGGLDSDKQKRLIDPENLPKLN